MSAGIRKVTASMNPANKKEVVGYIQESDEHDLDQAVEAATGSEKSLEKMPGPPEAICYIEPQIFWKAGWMK